jgi:hypothetical protein
MSNEGGAYSLARKAWDESLHPREPKGTQRGGEFASKGNWSADGGVVFHGTREEALPFIESEGVLPRPQVGAQAALGSVAFVTTKRAEAEWYANDHGWVMLEIHVPQSAAGDFQSLYGDTLGTHKTIPPEWIKAVYRRVGRVFVKQ